MVIDDLFAARLIARAHRGMRKFFRLLCNRRLPYRQPNKRGCGRELESMEGVALGRPVLMSIQSDALSRFDVLSDILRGLKQVFGKTLGCLPIRSGTWQE